ncbi:MAG: zinc protease [bacterium P3]|nr:MAG: zinc protease [bacterium P3]KWW42651.1 MAG: zinc protease [bacterium F083]
MKKSFLTMLLLLLAGSMAFAQLVPGAEKQSRKTDLSAPVPVDKKVRIGKLDNGFTYYIRANRKPENRIQFRMVSNAGSILEDESQRGLAHFCEHMAFNGIEGFPHNKMIDTLQKNGIEFGRGINAWTSFDETVYYVEMPADRPEMVQMGLDILNGWAGNLLFDPQEIEDERGVIHEEWRGGQGAGERLRDKTWPTMLKGSRYAERLPIGLESVILGFKRDDIVRFYKDWYRPDMQAVVIVGDIKDVDEMEARVKEIFGKHQAPVNPKPRPSYDIPDNKEPLVAIAIDKEATSTSLMFFWKHPKAPQGTVGDYRQSLVRQLINSMLDDRFNELCEKATSPMMGAGAGYGGFLGRSCDAFVCSAAPKENRIEDATRMLLTELRRVDQHGFLQTELDRQKEELISRYTKMAKEENKTQSNSLAQEYTNNYLEGEVIPGIRWEWQRAKEFVPGVTLEEVNTMVQQWITEENFVYYLTGPDQEGYRFPTESEVLKIYNETKNIKTDPWVDNFKDEPLFAKELPAVKDYRMTKNNTILGYKEYTLPNGVRFIVKKTDLKEDEIIMSSYAWGGLSLYEDKDVYAAQSAAGLVDDAGIAQFSSTQLQKKLKGVNLSISPSISQLSQGFSGNCSPKDLETMLQLLYLYYDEPRKDQESFDKNIDALRNQLKFVAQNPQFAFLKKFYETAYPGNKRQILLPTEEQLNSLNLDKIYSIFRERFHDASNQLFVFVGNVADGDVDLIAKYLGSLPCDGTQAKETWVKRENKFAKGMPRETVYKGEDNQGMLIIYGESEKFDATPKNRMIVSQLSDAMEITALEVIREKMGGTYSPSVKVDYELLPDKTFSWMFYIGCDPDKAADVEAAALEIVKGYIKNGPDATTLGKVQEQMIINRENAMQNNGYWMNQILGSYQYNESRDGNASLEDYSQRVKAVTAKHVQSIAKKYINLKNYVVVTLKPEAGQKSE